MLVQPFGKFRRRELRVGRLIQNPCGPRHRMPRLRDQIAIEKNRKRMHRPFQRLDRCWRHTRSTIENGKGIVIDGNAAAIHKIILGPAQRRLDRQQLAELRVFGAPGARRNHRILMTPALVKPAPELRVPHGRHGSVNHSDLNQILLRILHSSPLRRA